jgi:formylglycine-generating enzyme required for sulfatase activity
MRLKLLPAGNFTMGEGSDAHQVTLTKPFYLGIYEVTQEEYQRVMGSNPSHFKGARNPVAQVSWDDAVEFCRKLSAMPEEKKAGRAYRLPTEAEWEYACRAGSTTEYCFGDNESQLGEYAWFDKNAGSKTHPVGEKKPNAWGLYDMHGNVWEWCSDWYSEYPKGAVSDPVGPREGSDRVFRGGSWRYGAAFCRSAFRYWYSPSYRYHDDGFRVALSSPSGIPQ